MQIVTCSLARLPILPQTPDTSWHGCVHAHLSIGCCASRVALGRSKKLKMSSSTLNTQAAAAASLLLASFASVAHRLNPSRSAASTCGSSSSTATKKWHQGIAAKSLGRTCFAAANQMNAVCGPYQLRPTFLSADSSMSCAVTSSIFSCRSRCSTRRTNSCSTSCRSQIQNSGMPCPHFHAMGATLACMMRQISLRSTGGTRGRRAEPPAARLIPVPMPPAAACRWASSAAARALLLSERQRSQVQVSSRCSCSQAKAASAQMSEVFLSTAGQASETVAR